ncbi:hypothetical protein J3L16_09390 [Alteromonas sp. 5E99-2]|uniref:hypothetical protein n=1 Tax=Alteromonas sp. 5E99-2 TaxID=2817683 RepID=UPI001A985B30|nr:hypothetical protein [Alteromonas sp. 5E99-2]MBO1255895.1 hypothetical protein [Alteromonas sp. 5E99-2]
MLSLKNIMAANGISCIGFGGIFIFNASTIANFLTVDNSIPLMVLKVVGLILVLNGIHLLWSSTRQRIKKWLMVYFCLGDMLWVITSLALVIFGLWITTIQGIVATIIIAIMVGYFGVMQWFLDKQTRT